MFKALVPATSANLGPGFDALGLAVSLYLEVKAELSPSDAFYYSGEGQLANSANNLMHKGFRLAYEQCKHVAPKVSFSVQNPIPLARGLGSSSAALVAGIALADAFMNHPLGRDGVFQLSAKLEGHPDNVAPACYGGFTASAFDNATSNYICESLAVPENWQLLFGVPYFELLTEDARAALPESYSRADLVFSASRTALWTLAVVKDKPELLKFASQDVIHEPYREKLIPHLAETRALLRNAGAYAAFLSGAGPTLAVICPNLLLESCQKILGGFVGNEGQVKHLSISKGYEVTPFKP